MPEIRNIGIFAHVDAGKTTLTEQLLLVSGAIRVPGRVDKGTTHTDTLPVERRRGISVKAACAVTEWKGVRISIIDTPGHTDFISEIERSFWALDAAVLVIDACEAIKPQTEILFSALVRQKLPFIIFLNKLDRANADAELALGRIKARLTQKLAPLDDAEALTEYVCGCDETLTDKYLSGEAISASELEAKLAELTACGEAFPLVCGSALKGSGINTLLDAMITYLPAPERGSAALCACAYSSCTDRLMGRGLWVRVFSGKLEARTPFELPLGRDPLTGEEIRVQRKITQIRDASGSDTGCLSAGETGTVYGLGDTPIGHIFGERALLPKRIKPGLMGEPLINVRVTPVNPEDMQSLRSACAELTLEDPLLRSEYLTATGELLLRVMGRVQLEIIQDAFASRFGIDVTFGAPQVIYKETLASPAKGFAAYTMPKPCWAIIEIEAEPLPCGSGVVFESKVGPAVIPTRYQHQIEQALPLALKQGRLGWQTTDIKITLTGGSSHQWHTHPLDFIVATPMAVQDALRRGGSVLLEPLWNMRFMLPADCVGRIMTDISAMRGEVTDTLSDGEYVYLSARVPVSESMDYPTVLASVMGGRGSLTSSPCGYAACPADKGKTAARRGVDPLDTAKYILAARSALEGGIFDF
ncbi:MAG: TetM/TetW/TetO/TetS family tetracycline resistance ribosomal protection protein [Clostridia bacterium]|nr:TetM/TetW/TetO/TetS family tetracycline resistance ribosomal protection protein [Clostridia bacterium]